MLASRITQGSVHCSRGIRSQLLRPSTSTVKSLRFSTLREARAARRGRLPKRDEAAVSDFRNWATGLGVTTAVIGVISYASYEIRTNPKGKLADIYIGSPVEAFVNTLYKYTFGNFDHIFDPAVDQLIPTWPTDPYYAQAQIPPGAPPPPLLVLDLEKTLVGSEYDSVHGWRHVKRPGLDKFLRSLHQYYEVVLFSENDIGMAQDIMAAVDPEQRCFYLGASAAESRGTLMLKRLDYMNRDIRKIILIDDNPDSAQLFPRNTIYVPPFDDVHNKHDTVLEDLIPLLQAFVHDGVQDVRDTLDNLGTHEAAEAVAEYRMRLQERKQREKQKRNRGIGGLIRGVNGSSSVTERDGFEQRSSILSPTAIVGSADGDRGAAGDGSMSVVNPLTGEIAGATPKPRKHAITFQGRQIAADMNATAAAPQTKKTGKIFQWLKENEQNNEEQERLKREKMNELYSQRMQEKAQRESQQQNQ